MLFSIQITLQWQGVDTIIKVKQFCSLFQLTVTSYRNSGWVGVLNKPGINAVSLILVYVTGRVLT